MSEVRLNELLAAAQQRAERAEIERDAALEVAADTAQQIATLRRLALALCDGEIAYTRDLSYVSCAALVKLRKAVEPPAVT